MSRASEFGVSVRHLARIFLFSARGCRRISAPLRVSFQSSPRAAHRSSSVDAFMQSVHLSLVSQAHSQAVAMLVAIASNYVFKPTAEGLSLWSNLAASGGLTLV